MANVDLQNSGNFDTSTTDHYIQTGEVVICRIHEVTEKQSKKNAYLRIRFVVMSQKHKDKWMDGNIILTNPTVLTKQFF